MGFIGTGENAMIALFAMSMMIVTAGFAIASMMPVRLR
jgi:hypothetical protein